MVPEPDQGCRDTTRNIDIFLSMTRRVSAMDGTNNRTGTVFPPRDFKFSAIFLRVITNGYSWRLSLMIVITIDYF